MKTFFPLVVCTALLVLAGCRLLPEQQPDTVRYFTLSTVAPTEALAGGITMRPVHLAGHLRNRAMAVRVSENEVIYLEDVRWAESLGDAVTQLLRAKLSTIEANSVVSVQVQRLELVRSEGNQVQLSATYTILSSGPNASPARGSFQASPRTWDGKDYGALVGQLREVIGELGGAIAAALPPKT